MSLRQFKIATYQTECSRLEQRSVIKFLLVEKCKPYEIYKRMCNECWEACFCFKKMFTNGLNMFAIVSLSKKESTKWEHMDSLVKKKFYFKQFSLAIGSSFNGKTVLFHAIQFTINMQFSSIWSIEGTLSGATSLGHSEPGSDTSEGILHIPQSSSITGTLPTDCLVSYLGQSFEWGVLPLCRDTVYFTAPADQARAYWLTVQKIESPN